MTKKVFVFDAAKCNGCHGCQIACKDEHVGNDWSPAARPQPDTGHFWLKMIENVRGTAPKVKVHYTINMCMHCDDAPCMKACPMEGAIYKRQDGLVIINPGKCTGCKSCVDICPYHAIYFNDELNIAQKCTGCAHLLDQGWKEPRCVDFCPTLALRFIDESELEKIAPGAEVLKAELGTRPRVYYAGIPRRFVGGLVYDPVKKEIVKGAACTLTNDADPGENYTVMTDGFGDFWFKELKEDRFSLKIEAEGFAVKEFKKLDTAEDINLGEIPLTAVK
ncbi:MAG: 4Fe-4S dicluster domain-containing protein [Dehalococcoidales bacterium]|nr:4Fe-4S dicluster domain-containing protein [Dehalococcoidales bacterium]